LLTQFPQARKRWSSFTFIVKLVDATVSNGSTLSTAIHSLDTQRGSLTLSQFHRLLQPKKGSREASPSVSTAPAAAGMSVDRV